MFGGPFLHLDVGGGADGGAVDKEAPLGAGEQGTAAVENAFHRLVIGDDGDDDVGVLGDFGQFRAMARADFLRQRLSGGGVDVKDGGDVEVLFLEASGHIGAHASHADESDFF